MEWETSSRRSLEAVCGHSVDAISLIPHLKFAPTCGPRIPACRAVGVNFKLGCSGNGENVKVVDHESGCSQGAEHVESQQTPGQVSDSVVAVKVDMVCAVRVFLVAHEPVGRLPSCVHLHVEVGVEEGTCQSSKNHTS